MAVRSNNDLIKGGQLMVFIWNGNSDYVPIAFATNHTLSLTRNTQEISSKDHGDAPAIIPTTQSWEITSENLMSEAGYAQVLDAYLAGDKVQLMFTLAHEYAGTGSFEEGIVGIDNASNLSEASDQLANWSEDSGWTYGGLMGDAYITSLNVNAPSGDNATFTATFTGTGNVRPLGTQPVRSVAPSNVDENNNEESDER